MPRQFGAGLCRAILQFWCMVYKARLTIVRPRIFNCVVFQRPASKMRISGFLPVFQSRSTATNRGARLRSGAFDQLAVNKVFRKTLQIPFCIGNLKDEGRRCLAETDFFQPA
jgi:hypothetical protein